MPIDTDNDGIPDEGMLEIWATDFDAGRFHVCGYDITLSFSADPDDQSVTYTCADLGQQVVEIWATDENGNQDYVITYIIIQDNNDACDGTTVTNGGVIAGTIKKQKKISMLKMQRLI